MIIRRGEIKDLEKIAILIKKVSDIHCRARKNTFKSKKLEECEEYVRDIMDNEKIKVIVAEDNNLVCRSSYI